MGTPSEQGRMKAKAHEILADLLGVALGDLDMRGEDANGADLIRAAGAAFVLVINKSTAAAPIAAAAKKAKYSASHHLHHVVPIVVVPFMGEVGRKVCEEAGVGWFDLGQRSHRCADHPGDRRGQAQPLQGRWPAPERLRAQELAHRPLATHPRRRVRSLNARSPVATGLDEGIVSRLVAA